MSEYQSNYTGPQIDEAINKIRNFDTTITAGFLKVESSELNPIDLNDLLTVDVYEIEYYINGVSTSDITRPIYVQVYNLTDDIIAQTYMIDHTVYTRTYDTSTTIFGSWGVDTSYYEKMSDGILDALEGNSMVIPYFSDPTETSVIEFDVDDIVIS